MITCSQYDYIELVCLYHYPIEVSFKSGEILAAIALDTKRNEEGKECIEVEAQEGKQLLILETIVKLTVTIKNPHFQSVSFD